MLTASLLSSPIKYLNFVRLLLATPPQLLHIYLLLVHHARQRDTAYNVARPVLGTRSSTEPSRILGLSHRVFLVEPGRVSAGQTNVSYVYLKRVVEDDSVPECSRDVRVVAWPERNALVAPRHAEQRGEVEQLVAELSRPLRTARPQVEVLPGRHGGAVVSQQVLPRRFDWHRNVLALSPCRVPYPRTLS